MTIEYQIVWVDDSQAWVDSVIGEIKEYIEELGFTPNITRLESGERFAESCSSVELDLIIVDYNLPDGKNGDLLISDLRTSGIFKEVVFYSQQGPPKDLIGVTDGVFHSTRDDAVSKIKAVIDLTVHKLRDLEVVRGLIIASTIDLEVKLEDIMILAFGDYGQLFQGKVLEKHVYDFEKKAKFVQSYLNDMSEKETATKDQDALKTMAESLKTFAKDVIDQRNILAHARKQTSGNKTILQGLNKRTKQIDFDDDWLSKTRQILGEHMSNLLEIETVLTK